MPPPRPGGRPIKYPRREIVNAILYILRAGTAWRMLPHDLPPYRIAFHYYRTWRRVGVWLQVNDALRKQTRQSQGRDPEPSAAIIGRQSVKTTEQGAPRLRCRQKSDGCKRHIVVDTEGLLLAVAAHPADVQDRDGARLALAELAGRLPRLRLIWADGGYRGALRE